MILDYLSDDWFVQAIFVIGVFASFLAVTAMRKIERADLRSAQAEREKLMLIEHKRHSDNH